MLELKYSATEFHLKTEEQLSNETTDNIIRLIKEINVQSTPTAYTGQTAVREPIPQGSSTVADSVVRKRLPNFEEEDAVNQGIKPEGAHIIDLSKIGMEKPKITKHTHFRCPCCGQSVITVVNDIMVLRDLEQKDNLAILSPGYDLNNFDYEDAKQHVTDVGVFLAADGHTQAHCPKCGGERLIEAWVQAFETPLSFFEYENPCPLCGSETALNINSQGKSVVKCDKPECGYVLKEE